MRTPAPYQRHYDPDLCHCGAEPCWTCKCCTQRLCDACETRGGGYCPDHLDGQRKLEMAMDVADTLRALRGDEDLVSEPGDEDVMRWHASPNLWLMHTLAASLELEVKRRKVERVAERAQLRGAA